MKQIINKQLNNNKQIIANFLRENCKQYLARSCRSWAKLIHCTATAEAACIYECMYTNYRYLPRPKHCSDYCIICMLKCQKICTQISNSSKASFSVWCSVMSAKLAHHLPSIKYQLCNVRVVVNLSPMTKVKIGARVRVKIGVRT